MLSCVCVPILDSSAGATSTHYLLGGFGSFLGATRKGTLGKATREFVLRCYLFRGPPFVCFVLCCVRKTHTHTHLLQERQERPDRRIILTTHTHTPTRARKMRRPRPGACDQPHQPIISRQQLGAPLCSPLLPPLFSHTRTHPPCAHTHQSILCQGKKQQQQQQQQSTWSFEGSKRMEPVCALFFPPSLFAPRRQQRALLACVFCLPFQDSPCPPFPFFLCDDQKKTKHPYS